jgi:hypothetical protein
MNELKSICRRIDEHATGIPRDSGLVSCLYIPIAARDQHAIETYVGKVVSSLAHNGSSLAVLVHAHDAGKLDDRLAIWDVPSAITLHAQMQVWVHVDYTAYRQAYRRAFPDANLAHLVLDHVMNRRVARLKGFAYVRIVPISRGANSSHGALSEDWGVKYHSTPRMREINRTSLASVQYADIADIAKMLNLQGGGSLMDGVNEAQKLVDLPDAIGNRRLSATRPVNGGVSIEGLMLVRDEVDEKDRSR